MPSPRQFARALARELRRELNLLVLERVDSTNRLARDVAERLDLDPATAVVVLALEQERGRGRGGRRWSSRPGAGVWVSWVGEVEEERLMSLPSRVGVSLCRHLDHLGVVEVGLKWPNDLLCNDRKLGGILCRSLVRGERTLAVCGVGVNVENPGAGLERSAVGLREKGIEADLATIAIECVRAVDAAASGHRASENGPDAWRALLDRYSVHRPGDAIAWHDGGESKGGGRGRRHRGTFVGFDEAGRLRVEVEGREEVVASGEID